MCLIVIAVGAAPGLSLVVAANRDEQHARPTRAAEWWPARRVFGGRDLLAGGTWLAVERRGRFAAVTNIRDSLRPTGLRSRGSLVAGFLSSDDSAADYAARAVQEGGEFGAFNLLLYDGSELHFASNRSAPKQLDTGLHAFSNAPPGSEWPKTATALAGAERSLDLRDPVEALFVLLAQRDDAVDPELKKQRDHFVVGPVYGTRCSTVALFDAAGRVSFAERTFDADGALIGEIRERFELER